MKLKEMVGELNFKAKNNSSRRVGNGAKDGTGLKFLASLGVP